MNINTCRRTNEQEIRDFFRHPFLVCLLDCITQTWFDPTYKGLIDQIKSEGMNGNKALTLTYIYICEESEKTELCDKYDNAPLFIDITDQTAPLCWH